MLRPKVVGKLDELYTYGMLPGRINFLRGLSGIFGKELLNETKLNWIPVTLPPGDLVHHSRQQLLEALRRQTRVLLAVGASPGGTYGVASSRIPTAELGRMTVLSIVKEEIDVSYSARNKLDQEGQHGVVKGSLDHVLSVLASGEEGSGYGPRTATELDSRLILTGFLMDCIAQSWGMSVPDLRGQTWYLHYADNILYGDLRKV